MPDDARDDSGTPRYEHIEAHLCQGCSGKFREGDDVVCLSDGYVEIGAEYRVSNRRFFHTDCWIQSDYMKDGGVDEEIVANCEDCGVGLTLDEKVEAATGTYCDDCAYGGERGPYAP